jgi:VCBS repeat-containing protein
MFSPPFIPADGSISFEAREGRQAYMVLIEGEARAEDILLKMRDAMEITEQKVTIEALQQSHILVIEMPKSII